MSTATPIRWTERVVNVALLKVLRARYPDVEQMALASVGALVGVSAETLVHWLAGRGPRTVTDQVAEVAAILACEPEVMLGTGDAGRRAHDEARDPMVTIHAVRMRASDLELFRRLGKARDMEPGAFASELLTVWLAEQRARIAHTSGGMTDGALQVVRDRDERKRSTQLAERRPRDLPAADRDAPRAPDSPGGPPASADVDGRA